MVIQCPACQTRFRLASDKVKGDGIKVRCSKCKHIFAVSSQEPAELTKPAAPSVASEPKAEPPVSAQVAATPATPALEETPSVPEPPSAPAAWNQQSEDEIDFGDHNMEFVEEEPAGGDLKFGYEPEPEQSDEFSFGEPEGTTGNSTAEANLNFGTLAGGPTEFDFSDEAAQASAKEEEFSLGNMQDAGPKEFSFADLNEERAPVKPEEPAVGGDFSFGAEATAQGDEFSFDDSESEADKLADDFAADSDEFDFGDEGTTAGNEFSFGEEEEEEPFDFGDEGEANEPFSFEDESPKVEPAPAVAEEKQDFGLKDELDFGSSTVSAPEPEEEKITKSVAPPAESSRPTLRPAPKLPPKKKKKSPYRGVLLFMLLLLLGLGGAAGYFYYQGDTLDWRGLLAKVTGQAPLAPAKGQIQLSGLTSYFVKNRESGQLFIIEGQVINQYPEARSAIAVKGILFNAQGKQALQQTVFAGNPMDERALRTLPFNKIQENMNNQFGDSLSNLNVEPNKSIPFTIVFRNLPSDLAEFTVEVADSKPGGQQ